MKKLKYFDVDIEIPYDNYKHQKNEPTYNRIQNQTYEIEELQFTKSILNDESVVLYLGGSIGVLPCATNNLMSNKENMVCVEANPNLIETLKNNRDINNLNFFVHHAPVSSVNKEVNFNFNGLTLSGSIKRKDWLEKNNKAWGEYTNVTMKTVTPIDLEEQYNLDFNTLICDIEGEEFNLLYDLYDYFKKYNYIIVEIHGWASGKIKEGDIYKLYSETFTKKENNGTILFTNKNLL